LSAPFGAVRIGLGHGHQCSPIGSRPDHLHKPSDTPCRFAGDAYADQIDITYDAYGATGPTTDILIDVVGYTMYPHFVYVVASALPFADSNRDDSSSFTSDSIQNAVVSVTLATTFEGSVTVSTSTNVSITSTQVPVGEGVQCSISDQGQLDSNYLQEWAGQEGDRGQLAGTRVFPVAGGEIYTFDLWCKGLGSISPDAPVVLRDSVITAIFTPPHGEFHKE
jgi:hypothetical protein